MFSARELIESAKVECFNVKDVNIDLPLGAFQYDSRILLPNEIFVALESNERDGHDFIENAVSAGASAVLVNKAKWQKISNERKKAIEDAVLVFLVADPLQAMGKIASRWRDQFDVLKVFAVTGSNGKTTTKDLLAHILKYCYQDEEAVVYPEESLNNHIGVPRILSKITTKTKAVVLEVGTNHFGELKYLAELSSPEAAAITNIGESHLEFLQDKEGVFKAKRELFDNLKAKSPTWYINIDDDYLKTLLKEQNSANKITYSLLSENADFFVKENQALSIDDHQISNQFKIIEASEKQEYNLKIPLPGMHNIQNALVAFIVAKNYFKIEPQKIIAALQSVTLSKHRSNLLWNSKGNFYIYDDAYNANPTSMRVALKTIAEISNKNFLVALGEMKEVGEKADEKHFELGRQAVEMGALTVLASGAFSQKITAGALSAGLSMDRIFAAGNPEELADKFLSIVQPKQVLLVKGSRGAKMERLIDIIH